MTDQFIADGAVKWRLKDIHDLHAKLRNAKKLESKLRDEIQDLEDDLEAAMDRDPCDPDEELEMALRDVRRMIARGDYKAAMDHCDRLLPASLRYAQ